MSDIALQNAIQPNQVQDAEPVLTLDDLLDAESEVLNRLGRDHDAGPKMAGHNSTSTGHRMSGSHSSHVSAQAEHPLAE